MGMIGNDEMSGILYGNWKYIWKYGIFNFLRLIESFRENP